LPSGVLQRDGERLEYRLVLQKQPGTLSTSVNIDIQIPSGYQVSRASPKPISVDDKGAQFALALDSDTTVELIMEQR
ncbi:MAG: hypothetical protein V3U26_07190, partial [Dehalococcoidia bacterium]